MSETDSLPPDDKKQKAGVQSGSWSDEPYRMLVDSVRDYAIFLLDPEGNVASWNVGAERMKGYKPDEIIGRHFSLFYPRSAVERGWPERELETARRLGHFEDEGWRVRKDGTTFWANVLIAPVRDAEGRLLGYSKVTRDLSERRENEERLRLSEERFRLLVESVEDYAIFMLDPEGRVVSWNAGARKIMGYAAEEIVGHVYDRFFRADERAEGAASDSLEQARLHRRSEQEGYLERKGGTRFWGHLALTSLHGDAGELLGYTMLVRDLSERKRMESLEEQGRHLTEFLAMLAHELRNPLAPIRNAVAIMAATRDLPSQVSWSREVIERQAAQLSRLVEDLLDVSRITRGKLRLQSVPMDVDVAVQRAIEASRPLIDARRHRLHVHVPAGMAVHGDMARLSQVFLNILNNAAKYTAEGGEIRIDGAVEDGDVVVRIRDNGVGIAPALLERVFDLFAQGERTLDRSEGGLGIGLTLARRIVALHGGNIIARSEGPGRGAEFEVRLPRLRAGMGRDEPAGRGNAAVPGGPRRAILVVDDNVDSANSMALLLRMSGHDVEVAHDGPSALRRVSERRPQIVLLDIGLPGMSGYQVAEELRARADAGAMRIYAMTGYGQKQDRQRSQESGFDGHLVKPVAPDELFRLIDNADPGTGRGSLPN